MSRWIAIVVLGFATPAVAEPCAWMGLELEVMRPQATVAGDGGIVVAQVPKQSSPDATPTPLTGWKVQGGKVSQPNIDRAAPGLFIVKPPTGTMVYSLHDGATLKGKGKVGAATPQPLGAPAIASVESGATTSKHVTRFVNVNLAAAAPRDALALVLIDAKGTPIAWGRAIGGTTAVISVYNTMGGCVMKFPDGTVQAQPGDKVTALWVDSAGRRSPASAAVTVKKP
jgi:hypothetical protein